MDFPKRLSHVLAGIGIAVASDPAHGFFADNHGAFLGFGIHDDLIRSVNLIVGENTVLEYKPSRSPSFAVIHPFVQYSGDSVANEVVDLHVHGLLPLTAAVAVLVAVPRSRIGSHGGGGGGERRHREVGERGFHWRCLVGNGGHAAERMHVED